MNLIDAISCNRSAKSPVELSLSCQFPRQYGSVFDAVSNFFVPNDSTKATEERAMNQLSMARIISENIPVPEQRDFYLFGIDATTSPRPYAKTLQDRGIQYYPNPAPGNNPVIVGHNYSLLAALPEKANPGSAPWIIPLLIRRIPTKTKATEVGASQLADILKDSKLPFGKAFSAFVGDSSYSCREFLGEVVCHKDMVSIIRCRGNRTFYQIAENKDAIQGKGHPNWYGKSFNMKEPETWGNCDAREIKTYTLANGRIVDVSIEAWHDLIMRGKRNILMHQHPFILVRITVTDKEGKLVFKRPLWLILIGKRRYQISLTQAYEAYRQRYDLEHFFRFGKNKLLLSSYQTPEARHEENWWEIVGLAYNQLYLAAQVAQNLPYPWERYLPNFKQKALNGMKPPSLVQRDMARILDEVGTPAEPPKRRGLSPGRIVGYSPGKRERQGIILKKDMGTKELVEVRAP